MDYNRHMCNVHTYTYKFCIWSQHAYIETIYFTQKNTGLIRWPILILWESWKDKHSKRGHRMWSAVIRPFGLFAAVSNSAVTRSIRAILFLCATLRQKCLRFHQTGCSTLICTNGTFIFSYFTVFIEQYILDVFPCILLLAGCKIKSRIKQIPVVNN